VIVIFKSSYTLFADVHLQVFGNARKKRRKMLMKSMNIILAIAFAMSIATTAAAQVPAQIAPAKVGVVNTAAFSNTTGGITRFVNAIRTLDGEFAARRTDITQSIARLDELQKVPAGLSAAQINDRRDQAQTLQIQITRKQEDARTAYARRFSQLTDPIQKNILDSLNAFAKARGIDVLLDVSKFQEGLLLVNPGSDLTAAFIRDFNSKNP
jgi:Skp family chaperone for outer membrane proteins